MAFTNWEAHFYAVLNQEPKSIRDEVARLGKGCKKTRCVLGASHWSWLRPFVTQAIAQIRLTAGYIVISHMTKKSAEWMEWCPEDIIQDTKGLTYALMILNQPLVGKTGEFVLLKWNPAAFHVAVDGGAGRLLNLAREKNLDLVPDLITGDFDSVTSEVLKTYEEKGTKIISTPDQDATDFTKAVKATTEELETKNIEIDAILAFVTTTGRLDHVMGNLNTLYLAEKLSPASLYLISNESLTWLLKKGKHKIKVHPSFMGKSVGLIPLGAPCSHVTTTGLKWNLNNDALQFGALISTSNTYNGAEYVTVETDENLIWTMELNF